MQNLPILLVILSLAGQLVALFISASLTSLLATSPKLLIHVHFLVLTRSEDNLLTLAHLFASSKSLHTAWRGSCRDWTRESFLQIRNTIASSPDSLLLQALLLDPSCIRYLDFKVRPSELIGLFGSLPIKSINSRPLNASISLVEKLDTYGLWRRNVAFQPKAFRPFDNVPFHRLIDPYQAACNKDESFQALLVDYAHRRLCQSDLEAVTGTMFLLIFPITRSKASDAAKRLMQPGDPEEDQASLKEVMDICKDIINTSKATSLHSIATWMVESDILQGEEAKEVFPHSLITADSSHEITRLSLLLTLLSGAPSLEFIQTIQARLQECPIVEYIDLLFAISWTKPASGLFDTIVGSTRSRLVGLSPRFLGGTKAVILSQLTTGERRQMFRTSSRTFVNPGFNLLKDKPLESRILYFVCEIPLKSAPPADFPNVQQFLVEMLEDSLTRLVDLHVENVGDQRTLTFSGEHQVEHLDDIHAIFLALYLQLHFDFKEAPPIVVAPKLREFIAGADCDTLSFCPLCADSWL